MLVTSPIMRAIYNQPNRVISTQWTTNQLTSEHKNKLTRIANAHIKHPSPTQRISFVLFHHNIHFPKKQTTNKQTYQLLHTTLWKNSKISLTCHLFVPFPIHMYSLTTNQLHNNISLFLNSGHPCDIFKTAHYMKYNIFL